MCCNHSIITNIFLINRCDKWMTILKLDMYTYDEVSLKLLKVCSDHFISDMYINPTKRELSRLTKMADPFLELSTYIMYEHSYAHESTQSAGMTDSNLINSNSESSTYISHEHTCAI